MRLIKYTVVCVGVFFSLLISAQTLQASPWAAVGDIQLRNDVEILARYGVISGPVNTWPISWKQITRNFSRTSEMDLPPYVRQAVMRIQQKTPGEIRVRGRVRATNNLAIVRGFATTARNDLDADATLEYNNSDSGTTIHIQGGYSKGNGEDYAHLDGGYLSQDIGNWSVYAGAFDRWWGPGRESTLILSNNARPMPSVGLRRIEPKTFATKWLSWIGPWQWDMFVAKMEKDRDVSNTLFVGMRLTFEPIKNFEVGMSRTLQLCGDGRPCDFSSWTRALISVGDLDNPTTAEGRANEPGNQLASLDLSYGFTVKKNVNVKLYFEGTADDLIFIVPYTYARIAGATFYGPYGNNGSHWRITAEASDTTGSLAWLYGHHRIGIIYNHTIYSAGYRFKGRSLGHSLDSDSRLFSLAVQFSDANHWDYTIKFQRAEINIDGPATVATPVPNLNFLSDANINTNIFEASIQGDLGFGQFRVEVKHSTDGVLSLGNDGAFTSIGINWEINY